MATKATGNDCYEKAAPNEPVFTLRAQDVTADLLVTAWVRVQLYIRKEMERGLSIEEARASVATMLGHIMPIPYNSLESEKLREAALCADAMANWPTRKLPD